MSSPGGPSKKRTGRACTFCKSRKQKCGGYTAEIKCSACQQRKVRCSFEDEANDPRYNPYLRYEQAARRASVAPSLHPQGPSFPSVPVPLTGPSDQGLPPRVAPPDWFTAGTFNNTGPSRQYPPPSAPQPIASTSPTLNFIPGPKATPPQNLAGGLTSGISPTTSSPLPSDFRGPLRTLQPLVHDDLRSVEDVDPIQGHVLTAGEVTVLFQIFFKHCHPHAPFLDVNENSDWRKCRESSALLFLGILQVAARFWGHSSRSDTWLHPRYKELVALLDTEMARVTLRPHDGDASLPTLQGLLLYAHWMPLDIDASGRVRWRFSETGAWQALGLAIRWAQQLDPDRLAEIAKEPQVDAQRIQEFRTFAYLAESDHYLALSTRRRPTLDPRSLSIGSQAFLGSKGIQSTDLRVVSLLRVAHAASIISRGVGTGAVGVESVKAFDADVVEVEREYLEAASRSGANHDKHARQFPFISLRWYRLAFASVLLTSASSWSAIGETFHMAINWASQILFFLSGSPSHNGSMDGESRQTLTPEPALVEFLTFAIDHYYVVISYSAAFLTVAWRQGAVDDQLEMSSEITSRSNRPVSRTSLLYRLVDLAANALSACASQRDHLAIRYAHFIRGLAETLVQDPPEVNVEGNSTPSNALDSTDWDISYLWQQAGLDPGFLSLSAADLADISNDQTLFPNINPQIPGTGGSNGMWESLVHSATNQEQDLPIDYRPAM